MKFSILFLALFLMSVVSANGLTITSNSDFNITKEQDIDKTIDLIIYNSEPFDFYNIDTENDDVATMTEIPILLSGESINVTITLNKDNEFNGEIIIRGEYNTTIGASNQTEVIRISYDNGIDKCNLDLIKGDTVIWVNEDLDEIKLKNTDTDEYFTSIDENENYTKVFSESIVLNYLAVWLVPFTSICQINVQNDVGLVHKSEYDTKINLNLLINYKNTKLQTTFLTTSYSIDYNQNKEDTFAIKNIGNETARIKLTSENMIFSLNNFNLVVGDTININYEIIPFVIKTNETNKTYNEIIKIEGNFETLNKGISIYIKYANLDDILSENGEIDFVFWKNTLTLLCKAYPNKAEIKEFCQKNNYNINGVSNSSIKLDENSFRIFLERYGEDLIDDREFKRLILEDSKIKTEIDKNQTNILGLLKTEIEEINKNSKNSNLVTLFMIILMGSGISIAILFFLIKGKLEDININKKLGLNKFEKR